MFEAESIEIEMRSETVRGFVSEQGAEGVLNHSKNHKHENSRARDSPTCPSRRQPAHRALRSSGQPISRTPPRARQRGVSSSAASH